VDQLVLSRQSDTSVVIDAVLVVGDLCEKLWQAFSHFHCNEGIYARNDKDYQPQA